jgi:hypothetical protein
MTQKVTRESFMNWDGGEGQQEVIIIAAFLSPTDHRVQFQVPTCVRSCRQLKYSESEGDIFSQNKRVVSRRTPAVCLEFQEVFRHTYIK